jgi:hypothetical protein
MDKIKLYSDLFATWVAIIGAGVSGTFALVQYYSNSSAERAKVALEYVERFNRSPLQDARSRLEKFWDKRAEAVFARTKAGDKELTDFVVKTVRGSRLTGDIDLVVEFFEDLHACTCGKVCDEALAKRFFGKYSFDFYGLMFPYLTDQRRRLKDNSFGRGIESFAKAQSTGRMDAEVSCRV